MNDAWFAVHPDNLVAIAGMALVTVLLRFSGYILVRRVSLTGRVAVALESVPAAVLTALIVPVALATGVAESMAAAVTVLAAWRLPTLLAVAVGVASVVALRAVLPF